ncbi:MAG: stage II sporulation protein M [Christensenellales bacterium]
MFRKIKLECASHIRNNGGMYLTILFFLIIGIASGIFTVAMLKESQIRDTAGYLNGFLKALQGTTPDIGIIILQSVMVNFFFMLLLAAFGLIMVGIPLVFLAICVKGFMFGFSAGALVSQLGISGAAILLFCVIIPNIFLCFALMRGAVCAFLNCLKTFKERNIPRSRRGVLTSNAPFFKQMAFALLVMLVGIVLESVAAPYAMKLIATWAA